MVGMLEYWKSGRRGVEKSAIVPFSRSFFHFSILPSFHSSARSAGFTLIELLVALALLGILGASLAGVLRNSTESVDQAQSSIDSMTRLRSLEMLLGGALRDAVELKLTSAEKNVLAGLDAYETAEGDIRFCGEEQRLGFCLQRPFFSAERDGYMHWISLEILQTEDKEMEQFSLRLRDVSFIPGIDNPVGDDWNGMDGEVDTRLPVQTVYLLRKASALAFHYWVSSADNSEEPEEMEPEDIEGDYTTAVPDYITLEIKMVKGAAEVLTFDHNMRRKLLE